MSNCSAPAAAPAGTGTGCQPPPAFIQNPSGRATMLIPGKPGRSSALIVMSIAPASWSTVARIRTATSPSGVVIRMVPPSV